MEPSFVLDSEECVTRSVENGRLLWRCSVEGDGIGKGREGGSVVMIAGLPGGAGPANFYGCIRHGTQLGWTKISNSFARETSAKTVEYSCCRQGFFVGGGR